MLGKIHLVFSIFVVIVFLISRQYMDINHNYLENIEFTSRALFRAGHLYILLFGLINTASTYGLISLVPKKKQQN